MPAKYVKRVNKEKCYFHILNRGTSGKEIFKDESDYEVFLEYLKEYLSPPNNHDTRKKTFTVKGRTFQGVPHQTKNYFNEVYLIAYSLLPNHFHLLLHQITKGSLEKFMRSLSTRYSMYFNKKYQCTGPLFEGPYKSIHIEGISPLLHLTRYFHQSQGKTSYAEFLGQRETPWIKQSLVLSFFNKSENKNFRGIGGYKNFVEKYEPDQNDEDILERIILETTTKHLEGSSPDIQRSTPRFPEYALATAIFIFLFSVGYRNVLVSSSKASVSKSITSRDNISTPLPSPSPDVAGAEVEKSKIMLVVKTPNESTPINIRESPTAESEKIGEAKNGDLFEFASINSGWYGVKLTDGSTGFIFSDFIEILETEGQ